MVERNMAVMRDADGYIENIIVVNGVFDPGPGKTLMDASGAQIGGRWDGAQYLPPPIKTPDPPRFDDQAKAIEAATTLDEMKAAVAALTRSL